MKRLILISFTFLPFLSFGQLLNLDFEVWDSLEVQNKCCPEVPQNWNHGTWDWVVIQKSDFTHSGDWALGLRGGTGGFDWWYPSFVQQKFTVPSGVDSIFAHVSVQEIRIVTNAPFCGFGLTKDSTIKDGFTPPDLLAGWVNGDSIPEYQRIGFAVPDSLWGVEVYLTAYSFPNIWASSHDPIFFIDDIEVRQGINSSRDYGMSDIHVFPNPTSTHLSVNDLPTTNFKAQIFDSFGRLVKASFHESEIDVSQLPAATYWIRIEDLKSNKVWEEKFVKI